MKRILAISLLFLTALGCTDQSAGSGKKTSQQVDSKPIAAASPSPSASPTPTPAATSVTTSAANQSAALAAANRLYALHFKENQRFEASHYKEWLDPELYQMLIKDQQESAKITDEIAGLDFNPLTSAQDDVGAFKIEMGKGTDQELDLTVSFASSQPADASNGKLILKMIKNGDKWQVKNILYPSADASSSDLISTLKQIDKERGEIIKEKAKGH